MEETTGKIVLSYDITGEWNAVRTAMYEKAYFSVGMSVTKTYELPDTTLTHQNKQVSEAINDLENVCRSLNIILNKAVAFLVAEEVSFYNH